MFQDSKIAWLILISALLMFIITGSKTKAAEFIKAVREDLLPDEEEGILTW